MTSISKNNAQRGAEDGTSSGGAGRKNAMGSAQNSGRKSVEIYSDGASRGNPGPGGYGCVLIYRDSAGGVHKKEMSAGFSHTTNNRMELMGAIVALEALKVPSNVALFTDSSYVVNAFNQNWIAGWKKRGWQNSQKKPVKNRDLWERLLCAAHPHNVTWNWVRGHAGHPQNERCDQLATAAADAEPREIDKGFEAGK